MKKKSYEKPEQRVIRLQPCRMLAQSGGAVRSVTGDVTGEWIWGIPTYDR